MELALHLPEDLIKHIDRLVERGVVASREEYVMAAVELERLTEQTARSPLDDRA